MSKLEEIIVEHTRLAADIAELRHIRNLAATEEEAELLNKKIEQGLEKIEELRKEREELRTMLVAEDVKGFDKLTKNAEMFKKFLRNFYTSWGTEARETIEPISVKYVKEKVGSYLRFDYRIYGKKEWLHVTSPTTWY